MGLDCEGKESSTPEGGAGAGRDKSHPNGFEPF